VTTHFSFHSAQLKRLLASPGSPVTLQAHRLLQYLPMAAMAPSYSNAGYQHPTNFDLAAGRLEVSYTLQRAQINIRYAANSHAFESQLTH